MISIKKEGLLFRLAQYGAGDIFEFDELNVNSENLCPFARQVFMGMFYCCIIACFSASLMVSAVVWPLDHFIGGFIRNGDTIANTIFLIMLAIGWMAGLIAALFAGVSVLVLLCFGCYESFKYIRKLVSKSPQLEQSFILTGTYIKAKHHKFCPPIKVV